MVRYTDTEIYKYTVDRALADIRFLTEAREKLVGIKLRGKDVKDRRKRTPEEQSEFESVNRRIKSAETRLQRMHDLTAPIWDLLHVLMQAEGTLWTPQEVALWGKELDANEGRGEEALKLRYEIPTDVTTRECDLVKIVDGEFVLYEEVKNLQEKPDESAEKDGRYRLQEIQTGAMGRHAYCMWMLERAEEGHFKHLNVDMRRALGTGELTASLIDELPPFLSESVKEAMLPFHVMGFYRAVNGTTKNGFVWIPREHFDDAWALTHVTKAGPKYALRKSYVVQRLQWTLTQDCEFKIPTGAELAAKYSEAAEIEVVESMDEEMTKELDWEVVGDATSTLVEQELDVVVDETL